MAVGDSIKPNDVIDSVIGGFWVAVTMKLMFSGSARGVFSMATAKDGVKIAVAQQVYAMVGRPVVQNTLGRVTSRVGI